MSVLVPLGLAALVALPIVVLLHMRHTTPLVRPVPTLRFWLAAEPERTERTRFMRPPLSLLLLLHLAIAALLAAALVRPVATGAWAALGALRTEPQHLILLLDGSTSMVATDTPSGRSRYEEARAAAGERLATLREGDVATLMLLGTRTATFGATDAASLRALRDRMGRLDPPGGRADLDAAIALARDLRLPDLEDRVVVLSDGAVAADPGTVADLGAPVDLALVGGAVTGQAADNVAVVDLSARATPSNPDLLELYARVVNFGASEVAAPVVLIGDTLEIGRRQVTLPANGGAVELTWPLPPGTAEVTVRADAADPLAADNVASLVLRQASADDLALRVLLVSDAPGDLHRVLLSLEGAEITTEPLVNLQAATTGGAYDLIVFEKTSPSPEQLAALATPLLFVNPPPDGPFPTEGTMPQPTVANLRTQDPLLAGVDLGGVTFGETPIYAAGGVQTVVVSATDGPLVFRAEVGGQRSVTLAFDPAASNLPRRVAFPILIANVVEALAPSPLPAAVPLGDPLRYRPRATAATVRVTPPGSDAVDLPLAAAPDGPDAAALPLEGRLREIAFADTGRPGVYAVDEIGADGEILGGGRFVVNAGHPHESELRPNGDLAGILATARGEGGTNADRSGLTDFWPLLAALGLVFLAMEWLVALWPRRRATGFRPSAGGFPTPNHRTSAPGPR